MNNSEIKYMRIAFALAKKGNPSPNPYVGAVIVRNEKIIGKGYHKKAGMPHAEVKAIANQEEVLASLKKGICSSLENKEFAKGATMYVNLEPCNHYGRTPPCTDAIIKAGIKKVVFGMNDPNPNVRGGGEEELRKNGIEVKKGVLENEAKKLNEVFIKYTKTKMPFVVLKIAMSMDGKIATKTGDSKWITSEKTRKYVHKLRSKYDAILVGINTILKDNPLLTTRINGKKNPIKIILDSKLRIPISANVIDSNLIMATSKKYNVKKKRILESKGAKIIVCGKNTILLKILLRKLGKLGITSVLVEGGSEIHGSFFDEKLVDKIILFYAPKIIGGKEAKIAIGGKGIENMNSAIRIKDLKMKKIDEDFVFEGYPELSNSKSNTNPK